MSATQIRSQASSYRSPQGEGTPLNTKAPAPVIEQLLALAYSELADLQVSVRTLTRHGLATSALPSADHLMAIAVLGDHGRMQVEEGLREHWDGLVEKGLIHGEMSEHSTPSLRMLWLVQPATSALGVCAAERFVD